MFLSAGVGLPGFCTAGLARRVEAEGCREPVATRNCRVSPLPEDWEIQDGGKGGDSGDEVEAVVRWDDRRTSMRPAGCAGCRVLCNSAVSKQRVGPFHGSSAGFERLPHAPGVMSAAMRKSEPADYV